MFGDYKSLEPHTLTAVREWRECMGAGTSCHTLVYSYAVKRSMKLTDKQLHCTY